MADYEYDRRRSDFGPERRRSRSPGQNRGYGARPFETAKLIDPFIMIEHVSYDYFSRWFQNLNPGAHIDDSMRTRYDDYTKDLIARTARSHVAQRLGLPYFVERYSGVQHNVECALDSLKLFRASLESSTNLEGYSIELPAGNVGYAMGESISPNSIVTDGQPAQSVVALKSIPLTIPRSAIELHIRALLGPIREVSVATQNVDKQSRCAWVLLQEGQTAEEATSKLNGTLLADPAFDKYQVDASVYLMPSHAAKRRVLWSQLNDEALVEQHLNQLEIIVERHDRKLEIEPMWSELKQKSRDNSTLLLDIGVEYLRKVHAFDYWHLQAYDSLFELETYSPKYGRPSASSAPSNATAFEAWSTEFSGKLAVYLDPDSYLAQLRQKSLEETVAQIVESKIKVEEGNRFRCQVLDCTKLFKDVPFVQKHIEKRHGEWIQQITQETGILIRYLADPNKEVPFREYREPKPRREVSPAEARGRRRSSPQQNRNNGYSGGNYRASPRDDYRRQSAQNYRDLDRPDEELPELDY